MQPSTLALVYRMREDLGIPIIIRSAIRCAKHNKDEGGKSNSAHLRGYALDVATPTSRIRYLILRWLFANDVPRIGVNYRYNFVHFDNDPSLDQDIAFEY
jgi:uncharacterized protein YcbK (DUF882 family)